jgi:hypothetical protein
MQHSPKRGIYCILFKNQRRRRGFFPSQCLYKTTLMANRK